MEKFPTQEKLNLQISKIEGPQDFDTIMEIQKNDGFEHSYYLTKRQAGKISTKRRGVFYSTPRR